MKDKLKLIKAQKFLLVYILLFIWIFSYPFIPLAITENNSTFEIKNGSNLDQITNQLIEIDILRDSFRFKLLTFFYGKSESFRRGQYRLDKNITPYELINTLANGKQIYRSIVFIEGQNFNHILNKVNLNPFIQKTITDYSESKILKLIGSDKKYLEGLFFPDSYFFYNDTLDIEVLQNSYKVMKRKLDYAWNNRSPNLPYKNKYEALIMASIIEKELGKRFEAPMIAGVLVNRLNKNMRLQSDPTVIYGMGDLFKGNIRKKDLLKDTPYNTYTNRGLPPSPICSPGMKAIDAALNPTKTDAFYFVAKGDRTHHFSKTLKEHNMAVRKYQR